MSCPGCLPGQGPPVTTRLWPRAYEAVRKFRVDNETIGKIIGEVDLEGRPVDRVVEERLWTRDTWQKWTGYSW
ncbi:MAG: hypothetical protein GTN74_15120 [Proteobacteria bacterium]|nr:hypothetical protein [Pseudomonadota bacterium]NIS72667.1 hypothetical protein [Pseudomonadota bacterium]